jgi:hypothetical protein
MSIRHRSRYISSNHEKVIVKNLTKSIPFDQLHTESAHVVLEEKCQDSVDEPVVPAHNLMMPSSGEEWFLMPISKYVTGFSTSRSQYKGNLDSRVYQ